MSTITIGEAAERSGVPASTLRYYDRIDLIGPVDRTSAGYRLYDDEAVDRLRLVAAVRRIGGSLDDARVVVARASSCAAARSELRQLVTHHLERIATARSELAVRTDELIRTAEALTTETTEGACTGACACTTAPAQPSIACTLAAGAVEERVTRWRTTLAGATVVRTGGATARVTFHGVDIVPELAALVAAERECCSFLSFAITVDGRGVGLEVGGPPEARPVIDLLLGDV